MRMMKHQIPLKRTWVYNNNEVSMYDDEEEYEGENDKDDDR